ncbi:MAG: HEAT repeat domain-containing protein [Bacteroidota bacterium]
MEGTTHVTTPGKPVEQLLVDLSDKHGATRQASREQLVAMGEPAVAGLIALLAAGENQTRWEAAKALSEIHSPSAAGALVTALEDREFGVRWLAAEGLHATGAAAIPPLLQALCEHPGSLWLHEGAHHVLKGVTDLRVSRTIAPVLAALEGVEPQLTVGPAAQAALVGWPGGLS